MKARIQSFLTACLCVRVVDTVAVGVLARAVLRTLLTRMKIQMKTVVDVVAVLVSAVNMGCDLQLCSTGSRFRWFLRLPMFHVKLPLVQAL